LLKNFQTLGKNFRKLQGGIFDSVENIQRVQTSARTDHTMHLMVNRHHRACFSALLSIRKRRHLVITGEKWYVPTADACFAMLKFKKKQTTICV